jgi:hypothetical protein
MVKYLAITILLIKVATYVSSSCIYNGAVAPLAGSCSGPEDRTAAMRAAILAINGNCPISQIPIPSLKDSSVFDCAECVPGSHGNYGIDGFQISSGDSGVTVVSSGDSAGKATVDNTVQILNTLKYQCPLNYYCNGQGKCDSMTNLPNYNAPCLSILVTLSLYGRTAVCGEQGLKCISNRCLICQPGTAVKHYRVAKDSNLTFFNRPSMIHQDAYCINGQYQQQEWSRMTDFYPYPDLMLTFIVCSTVTVCYVLYTCYSYCKRCYRFHKKSN